MPRKPGPWPPRYRPPPRRLGTPGRRDYRCPWCGERLSPGPVPFYCPDRPFAPGLAPALPFTP